MAKAHIGQEQSGRAEEAEPSGAALKADVPITSPAQDRLGRAAFARYLAQAIREVPADNGFVFALHGPWGSGKTSVLNLVERELSKDSNGKSSVLVVRFNPWWFSGDEAILLEFLLQLEAKVAKSGLWANHKGFARAFRRFGAVLAPVASAAA